MITPPPFWDNPQSSMARLLSPLGTFYGKMTDYLGSYAARPSVALPVPVICIGNLVLGGAGKTPIALELARTFQKQGKKVHFLSRGYGGSAKGPICVSEAERTHIAHTKVGDEPLLLAATAPVWVCKDRLAGARAAIEAGAEILIMDDGHQNQTLVKDFSFVVIDTTHPFGNGYVFPAGPLRESIEKGLSRSQGIVWVGKDPVPLPPQFSTLPSLRVCFEPHPRDLEPLRHRRIIAFAGIGRPQKFFHMLHRHCTEYDFTLIDCLSFPDHYVYSPRDCARLAKRAQEENAVLVTTEKDSVRLQGPKENGHPAHASLPIQTIGLQVHFLEGDWDIFFNPPLTANQNT